MAHLLVPLVALGSTEAPHEGVATGRRIVGGLLSETLRVVGWGAAAGLMLAVAVNRYGSSLRFAGWVASWRR